ncbi:Protein CHROMATIN REMODELING 4 [Bienertia sinuspersici]
MLPASDSCALWDKMPVACSSLAFQNSSRLGEKYDVQRTGTTNVGNMVLGSNESPGDNTFKISGESVSAGASLKDATSSIEKDSCSRHSSSLGNEGCVQGCSVSQPLEKDSDPITKQRYISKTEVAKGESNAPLLTFRRRLKRKADLCNTHMVMKLPPEERDTTFREGDSKPVLSCTCDGMSRESRLIEKSVEIKVERNDADLNQNSAEMTNNEIEFSSPCGQPSAETLTLMHTKLTSNSEEGLVVDTSPVTKCPAISTSGSIATAPHHPDINGITSLHRDDVRCCTYDGTVASSCNIACKMDDQPVSQHLRASSGDSQLTSSDSSDLKIGVAKRVEHSARSKSVDLSCPPPGAFVIDCNVVPESDAQEDASDVIQDSLMEKNSEKVLQKEHMKGKGLELFGDDSMQVENSPDGACTSIKTTNKPETKFLQLFSEDGMCGQCTSPNPFSHSKAHQNAAFTLDNQRHKLDQSSSKASPVLGLSLPVHEGQTSKGGPALHQFQNPNFRKCNLVQNPAVQSFPNQASFRHKQLLESINTRATSLRGNRNISLDKFEPCPATWSEEELDSLWIGIRRHGRGNWHAMLLDPRLRFAPWRVAADLEGQWAREQHRLFSGQHMSSSRYPKPQDAYKLHCHGLAAETQLSLGDVYAKKDGVTFKTSAPSYGFTQAPRHVTMASCSSVNYGCGPSNNVQTGVMIRGEVSPDAPTMAFGMNNCLPHWLKDPIIAPSRPSDSPLPHISTPPQMGGFRLFHPFPETSCRGNSLINTKVAGAHPQKHVQCGGRKTRIPGMADNLVVIDSDASSEETISDDNNIRV